MWETLCRAIGAPAIPTIWHVILPAVHVVPWPCMMLPSVITLTFEFCVSNSRLAKIICIAILSRVTLVNILLLKAIFEFVDKFLTSEIKEIRRARNMHCPVSAFCGVIQNLFFISISATFDRSLRIKHLNFVLQILPENCVCCCLHLQIEKCALILIIRAVLTLFTFEENSLFILTTTSANVTILFSMLLV